MLRSSLVTTLVVLYLTTPASGQINREIPKATPTIDGTISANEMATQLAIPMSWPMANGSLLLEGSGFSEEELSATWYVSWDDVNLNLSAIVLDDTPDFRVDSGGGNTAYNAQDVIQPVFNPLNDDFNEFVDGVPADADPGDGVAAIYDIVVNTSDDFGPDIYRHGPGLTDEQHESISLAGQETDTGYILEVSLPWAVAMDDYILDAPYQAAVGDVHGLGFILLSFNQEEGATGDIATLYTDFGEGENTIADPVSWNSITLAEAIELACNPNSSGDLDGNGTVEFADFLILSANFGNAVEDHSFGDIDCSGTVEFADFLVLSTNFGQSVTGAASVPEPSSDILLLTLCGCIMHWRRRRF